MQAPIEVSRRGAGEVFSLDILSHRMSEIALISTIDVGDSRNLRKTVI
jgi:hypothetical protein